MNPFRSFFGEAVLKGQFVIGTRNPFPGGMADRFFMAELDSVWKDNPAEAQRILDTYKALGFNHVPVGTVVDRGYSGHFPDADWRGQADRYAAFLQWLHQHGVSYTLFVLPDCAPYFLGTGKGWDWAAVERDITPILSHPTIQALTRRVAVAWEQWASIEEMAKAFDYLRRLFPNAERFWHNGPGHLSPGNSDESEEGAWRSAKAHGITGFFFQAHPPSDWTGVNEWGRTTEQQMAYDLGDMARRFGLDGRPSPWGAPITGLTLDYGEGTAYTYYWRGQDFGPQWGRTAKAVPGVRFALDGAA